MRTLLMLALLLQAPAAGTSKISGHMTSFPGAKIPSVMKLRVYSQYGPGNSIVLRDVSVHDNGLFEISGIAPGEYAMSLDDPFSSPRRNFTFSDGDVTDFEMKVPVE